MRPDSTAGTPARRRLAPEAMDGPLLYGEARRALRDLDRVNRWLLGVTAARRVLAPRLARAAAGSDRNRPVRLLDLGTGSGTLVRLAVRGGGPGGAPVRVVGVDRRLTHLAVGRSLEASAPEGSRQLRVAASVDALPFRDGAFDWTFSNLLFHHFDAEDNQQVLVEMRRCAHRGAAVVDLRRSRLAVVLARALFPLLAVGSVARGDGVLSIRQSWTVEEIRAFTREHPKLELRRRFPFRWSLVLRA